MNLLLYRTFPISQTIHVQQLSPTKHFPEGPVQSKTGEMLLNAESCTLELRKLALTSTWQLSPRESKWRESPHIHSQFMLAWHTLYLNMHYSWVKGKEVEDALVKINQDSFRSHMWAGILSIATFLRNCKIPLSSHNTSEHARSPLSARNGWAIGRKLSPHHFGEMAQVGGCKWWGWCNLM